MGDCIVCRHLADKEPKPVVAETKPLWCHHPATPLPSNLPEHAKGHSSPEAQTQTPWRGEGEGGEEGKGGEGGDTGEREEEKGGEREEGEDGRGAGGTGSGSQDVSSLADSASSEIYHTTEQQDTVAPLSYLLPASALQAANNHRNHLHNQSSSSSIELSYPDLTTSVEPGSRGLQSFTPRAASRMTLFGYVSWKELMVNELTQGFPDRYMVEGAAKPSGFTSPLSTLYSRGRAAEVEEVVLEEPVEAAEDGVREADPHEVREQDSLALLQDMLGTYAFGEESECLHDYRPSWGWRLSDDNLSQASGDLASIPAAATVRMPSIRVALTEAMLKDMKRQHSPFSRHPSARTAASQIAGSNASNSGSRSRRPSQDNGLGGGLTDGGGSSSHHMEHIRPQRSPALGRRSMLNEKELQSGRNSPHSASASIVDGSEQLGSGPFVFLSTGAASHRATASSLQRMGSCDSCDSLPRFRRLPSESSGRIGGLVSSLRRPSIGDAGTATSQAMPMRSARLWSATDEQITYSLKTYSYRSDASRMARDPREMADESGSDGEASQSACLSLQRWSNNNSCETPPESTESDEPCELPAWLMHTTYPLKGERRGSMSREEEDDASSFGSSSDGSPRRSNITWRQEEEYEEMEMEDSSGLGSEPMQQANPV